MRNCEFSDCQRPPEGRKALCKTHAAQLKSGKTLRAIRPYVQTSRRSARHLNRPQDFWCPVESCGQRVAANGVCGGHARVAWRMGIDPDELSALYLEGCAICGKMEKLCIDHDHACCDTLPACGKCVRGPLCGGCNIRVGHWEANPAKARKVLDYVTTSRRRNLKVRPAMANRAA